MWSAERHPPMTDAGATVPVRLVAACRVCTRNAAPGLFRRWEAAHVVPAQEPVAAVGPGMGAHARAREGLDAPHRARPRGQEGTVVPRPLGHGRGARAPRLRSLSAR